MKIPAVILALLLTSVIHAQTNHTGWLATFNTFKTGKKTSIHNDLQWRGSDELTHTQTFLARVGLNVKLNNTLTVTAGYAFIHNRRTVAGVTGYAPEHRIWQQLLIAQKFKHTLLSHRFRLEQRFISRSTVVNNELKNEDAYFANRIRYFARAVQPLNGDPGFKKGMFAALQNEVFFNFGNTANVNGQHFDQNRFYATAGYRINPVIDLEAGYLNQYVKNRSGRTNNHILQLAAYLKL